MEPVLSNNQSNTCSDPISTNCVIIPQAIPGLSLCAGSNLTTALLQEGTLLQTLTGALNLAGLNWGCLYSPTLSTYTCPPGMSFLADTTAPNGAGYCQSCPTPTTCFIPYPYVEPTYVTIANPTPPPTTLLQILQLIINSIPCCDPCSKNAGT